MNNREAGEDDDELLEDDLHQGTPSPSPSEERRHSRGGRSLLNTNITLAL